VIEKNLGNLQRIVRFMLGVAFAGWALTRPSLNGIEWLVIVTSLCLIANGIFSRCYLWYVLDIHDHEREPYRGAGAGDCARYQKSGPLAGTSMHNQS
jgi:hypothetical protein